jgi:hypothetical protein
MEYSKDNILFEDDKYVVVQSPNIEDGEKIGPDFLATTRTRYTNDFYKNKDVYFFINKEVKDTRYGIITLTLGRYEVYEFYDNFGNQVNLKDVFYFFPKLDKIITELVGKVDLLTTLTLIENGKQYDRWQLQRIDKNIKYVQYNERRPEQSKIYLTFDGTKGILQFFNFGFENETYIQSVLNPYGYGADLWDDFYRNRDEWEEGYLINSFNEENNELIDKIVELIKPEFFNWKEDETIRIYLSKLLSNLFDNQIENIIREYGYEYEKAGAKALKQELKRDFCNPFVEHNVQILVVKNYCFDEYKTWVGYLKELLMEYNVDSIKDLVEKLAEKYIDASLGHDIYDYPYRGDGIDSEAFNRDVTTELEKIIDIIEENPEKYTNNASENGKLILLLKKYPLNKVFPIDDERGSFVINGIKDGKLLVTHIKKNGEKTNKSFNFEEFNNFLSTGELFEHLVRKLKRML